MWKRIICLGMILIMLFSIAGCGNEPKGTFYSLEDAFEQGMVTHEDLEKIAYYYHAYDYDLDTGEFWYTDAPEPLDKKTIKNIKQTYVDDFKANGGKLTRSRVNMIYYGTYNDYLVMSIGHREKKSNQNGYHLMMPSDKVIDGIQFKNCSGLYACLKNKIQRKNYIMKQKKMLLAGIVACLCALCTQPLLDMQISVC